MGMKELFIEATTTADVPSDPVGNKLPVAVIDAWNTSLDYDKSMKRKFSYYDVAFKTDQVTPGHKGQITRKQNELIRTIQDHNLDVNATVKTLARLYPPKHF